ncbi:BTAD domain-containing putative transcriptional regulator [Nocardioides sp. Bht2]|uniref:BTAD domain-containing putative transcriptional regulator n=1 Tax=Nocardioides sp. Bht2 TaxID=3392297 RepID=UPI0039B5A40F
MRIAVLGAIDVLGGQTAAPTGAIAHRVLAVLVADANRPIHPDRLSDLVWPGREQGGANSLQAHISRWRKVLGAHRITFSPAGYTLVAGPHELDVLEFEDRARSAVSARTAGDLEAAIATCDAALALWHGDAFGTLTDDDCVRARKAELETTRTAVHQARLELWGITGAYHQMVGEAVRLIATDPWNEPVHRALARAHYGLGDQVTALQVLGDLETGLRTELGLDLGASSQLLREQILRQEPALDLAGTVADPPPVRVIAPLDRLAERVDEFPETTRSVLHTAALAGRTLDTALLTRALALDGPTMAEALAPALRAGLVTRTENGIGFASDGLHRAIADLVPPGQALTLHRRLGETLLSNGPGAREGAANHLAAAAAVDNATAIKAAALDHELTLTALRSADYPAAVRHAGRALLSASHLARDDDTPCDHPRLQFSLAEGLQRTGDFPGAMAAYLAATHSPDAPNDLVQRAALAYEECSLLGRRHRTGARDPSIVLLERALAGADPGSPTEVDLLAALAQALSFAGLPERATGLAEAAVAAARDSADPERLARVLLRACTVHDPVTGAAQRLALATEAVATSRAAEADELEVEALCALVPELMRAGRLDEAEQVIARVARLVDVQDNVLHRSKVPMWRAALALAAHRFDEAEILIEDFRAAGLRDAYQDTDRIHGFQSILLALGQRRPAQAVAVLKQVEDDAAFEPWQAATLLVADAVDDPAWVQRLLVPWSARRFGLSAPFLGVQVFCACLIADVVATHGDDVARARLADLVRRGVGQHQVLGAGAAILGDAALSLDRLVEGVRDGASR